VETQAQASTTKPLSRMRLTTSTRLEDAGKVYGIISLAN